MLDATHVAQLNWNATVTVQQFIVNNAQFIANVVRLKCRQGDVLVKKLRTGRLGSAVAAAEAL